MGIVNVVSGFRIFKRVYVFLALISVIVSVGTFGFMFIEKWTFLDALYMTIVTTSTVGFREIHELSSEGKIFTIFLIITSFGTFAFAISSITKYIMGGDYKINLKEYRTNKIMRKMENHVVICGFGRVGKQVAEDLISKNTPVLIIDNNDDEVANYHHQKDYVFLVGDSTSDEILANAKIATASAVITCLPKDADNLYVVLSARELNKKIKIISRATHNSAVAKLKLAGADNVIMPDSIGGTHMASLVANPDVVEFLDSIRSQGSEGVNIESIAFNELPTEYQFKKLKDLKVLKIRSITSVTIIGYKTADGKYIINPTGEEEIVPQSKLFVLGTPAQIQNLNELLGLK
jgi:voltage-gated potassium channel